MKLYFRVILQVEQSHQQLANYQIIDVLTLFFLIEMVYLTAVYLCYKLLASSSEFSLA